MLPEGIKLLRELHERMSYLKAEDGKDLDATMKGCCGIPDDWDGCWYGKIKLCRYCAECKRLYDDVAEYLPIERQENNINPTGRYSHRDTYNLPQVHLPRAVRQSLGG